VAPDQPNVARIYDYFLGGTSNLAVDRAAADEIIRINPTAPDVVRENRAFLGRAVDHLAREKEIRQYLDIGAGLPTMENVHQIARRVDPDARVVYVDNDPDVIAQSVTLLADAAGVGAFEADIRAPERILGHPVTRELIDFTQPVGLLLVSILHLLTDDDHPHALVHRYVEALPRGSYVVVSHGQAPDASDAAAESRESVRAYNSKTGNALNLRSNAQIRAFFDGLQLLEPGVVDVAEWHATRAIARDEALGGFYGGVARVG
jgi:trans-aconitate methyltransferase